MEKPIMNRCIICNLAETPESLLTTLRNESSWETLYEAAIIHKFDPILKLSRNPKLSDVRYHRNCRSKFTLKKTLDALSSRSDSIEESECMDENKGSTSSKKRVRRQVGQSSVYERKCIFCSKDSKYLSGSRTREVLRQAQQLRVDEKLRRIAKEKLDEKIMAFTSRDIVAAEAHYHPSCYKDYTRGEKPVKERNIDTDCDSEREGRKKLFSFIRTEIFSSPTVVPLVTLQNKLYDYMKTDGASESFSDSTKKNLKYHLQQEFGECLRFFNVQNRVYVVPHTLTFESLVTQHILLKNVYNSDDADNKVLIASARNLRNKIKSIDISNQVWPPHPDQPDVTIPEQLKRFLEVLLGRSEPTLIWSMSQDIIQGVLFRKVLVKKHLLLPTVVKTLTGNVELITLLNRLGHGCNYSKLLEIDTALCMEKLECMSDEDIPLPSFVQPSVPTILAYDNIDRLEETLSGAGTSHRINGIIIQPEVQSCTSLQNSSVMRSKNRSIEAFNANIPDYIATSRKNPPAISLPLKTNLELESYNKAKLSNFVWVMARILDATGSKVKSWTGFNICARSNVQVRKDVVGYLPTINSPATSMSSVQEILRNALLIKSAVNSEYILVVMDQALFAKACDIVWTHQQIYRPIILMMGGFHTICNLLSIIGKLFGDAGLKDLAVESGSIAEGSINKVLDGRQYNRGVRLHKLIYESCMRIIWSSFRQWMEENDPAFYTEFEANVCDDSQFVESLIENITFESYNEATESPFVLKTFAQYEIFMEYLRHQNGPLSTFWSYYLELVEILLGLIRANREGNWSLYLQCIEMMLPWCFAMDKINYARYLSIQYFQMANLQNLDNTYYEYFLNGGFSTQMSNTNPFGRIPVDQVIEETVNKDTQTAKGTRNFSLKSGTVSRYYLTSEFRAIALKELRHLTFQKEEKLYHPDLSVRRLQKDVENVRNLNELLQNDWTNPFDLNAGEIVNLSSGVTAPPNISDGLLRVKEKGREACKEFQQRLESGTNFYAPIKKLKIGTFSDVKMKVKNRNVETTLKSDRELFANLMLIAENRKIDMEEVFAYPFAEIPLSLANVDGTMRNTSKAALSKHLEKKVSVHESLPVTATSCVVIDGMAIIQKLRVENLTFGELSLMVLKRVFLDSHHDRVDVIFDVYTEKSIKQSERKRRGEGENAMKFQNIKKYHKIANWRGLLRSSDCKNKLTKYLVDNWREEEMSSYFHGTKIMFVTYGPQCYKFSHGGVEEIVDLHSSQEEADTRMMLHIQHASENFENIVCLSDDTDVMFLCMYVNAKKDFRSTIYLKRSHSRLINIRKLASAVGKAEADALIGLHAFSGCDTVSAFAGKGKVRPYNIMTKNENYIKAFTQLGTQVGLREEVFSVLQDFTCRLYSRNTKIQKVNKLSYNLFRMKQGKISSAELPPCEDALRLHARRANYQAFLWRQCLQQHLFTDPTEHGWIEDEDSKELCILWKTIDTARQVIMEKFTCDCKRQCKSTDCPCMKKKVKCSAICHSYNCKNQEDEEKVEKNDDKHTFDSDEDFFDDETDDEDEDEDYF